VRIAESPRGGRTLKIPRLPTSLKVALFSALLALAANLAVIGFIRWRTADDAVAALRQQVTEEAAVLDDVYASGGRPALDKAIGDTLATHDPQLLAAVIDNRGHAHAGNVVQLVGAPQPLREGFRPGRLALRGEAVPIDAGFMLRPLGKDEWLLSGRSFGERLQFQRTLEGSLWVALAISVMLGLLCGLLIARYVATRVRAVAAVADSITLGDFSRRVPLSGGDDAFDRLARQINAMLDRISTLMEELRLLTDSLAHDLRSPVGRLRARIDAAMRAENEGRRDMLLSGVLQEADSLMRILTTVLEIGRSEAMASRNQFAWLDPAELIAELDEMYEPIVEEAGCTLRVECGPALLPLFGHRQLIAQALTNLIDNALKYAVGGGEITLFAAREEGRLRLGVADRGPGIAPADRAEARRQFGRLDASRSKEGAGLGLSLAEAVAHLHQGKLELEDNRPGLRAVLVLPLAEQ
jgi:signal transduction histidine kinase